MIQALCAMFILGTEASIECEGTYEYRLRGESRVIEWVFDGYLDGSGIVSGTLRDTLFKEGDRDIGVHVPMGNLVPRIDRDLGEMAIPSFIREWMREE